LCEELRISVLRSFDYRDSHQDSYRQFANFNSATAMDHRNSPIVAKAIFILIVATLGGILISSLVADITESFSEPIFKALAPTSSDMNSAHLNGHHAALAAKTEACRSAIARSVRPLQST
jgi:hypothetical protein